VNEESAHYLRLLEERLGLLEALARGLNAARQDLISRDLEAIRGGVGEQQRLCAQMQALDAKLRAVAPEAVHGSSATGIGVEDTLGRVAAAQERLRQLNSAHQALLRRSLRGVQALRNFYQGYSAGYAAPPTPPSGTLCEERV
jgi:flagellar biosynthesis/type III secretory pathway chaperone